jgi:hypothetical protein
MRGYNIMSLKPLVRESGISQASHRVAVALEKDKKLRVMVEGIKKQKGR